MVRDSSSLRYKNEVHVLERETVGKLNLLRPVHFQWKESGKSDFGLIAEEVAEHLPTLVTKNELGEDEGVRYQSIIQLLIAEIQAIKLENETIKLVNDAIKLENEAIKRDNKTIKQELAHLRSLIQ